MLGPLDFEADACTAVCKISSAMGLSDVRDFSRFCCSRSSYNNRAISCACSGVSDIVGGGSGVDVWCCVVNVGVCCGVKVKLENGLGRLGALKESGV